MYQGVRGGLICRHGRAGMFARNYRDRCTFYNDDDNDEDNSKTTCRYGNGPLQHWQMTTF